MVLQRGTVTVRAANRKRKTLWSHSGWWLYLCTGIKISVGIVFFYKGVQEKSVHGHPYVSRSPCKQDRVSLHHSQCFVLKLKPCSHTGKSHCPRGSFSLGYPHPPKISSHLPQRRKGPTMLWASLSKTNACPISKEICLPPKPTSMTNVGADSLQK